MNPELYLIKKLIQLLLEVYSNAHVVKSDLFLWWGHQYLNTQGACIPPVSTQTSLTMGMCYYVSTCVSKDSFVIFSWLLARRHNTTVLIIYYG